MFRKREKTCEERHKTCQERKRYRWRKREKGTKGQKGYKVLKMGAKLDLCTKYIY